MTQPMPHRPAHHLLRNQDGAAAIEFALVMPMFLTLMIGVLDVGQTVYGKSILNGAVEQAARSASLETGNTQEADDVVEDIVGTVLPSMTMSSTRTSYFDFSDIGRGEAWNDANANGSCDNGEAYTDENRSGSWDAEIGSDGNGGASDVVIYTVTVQYTTAFPVPLMPDSWNTRTLTSTAVRKNQPFADQSGYASTAGVCS